MAEKLKSAEVGGRQAGYLFEFKSDGVYLTVYPADDSGMLFELSDMRQILKEYGVMDYDMTELARVVPVKDKTLILHGLRYILHLPEEEIIKADNLLRARRKQGVAEIASDKSRASGHKYSFSGNFRHSHISLNPI